MFYESERYEVRIVGQVLIDLESGGIFKSPIESRFDEAVPVPPPMNGWCTELGPRSAQVFLFDRPLRLCSVNNYPERLPPETEVVERSIRQAYSDHRVFIREEKGSVIVGRMLPGAPSDLAAIAAALGVLQSWGSWDERHIIPVLIDDRMFAVRTNHNHERGIWQATSDVVRQPRGDEESEA